MLIYPVYIDKDHVSFILYIIYISYICNICHLVNVISATIEFDKLNLKTGKTLIKKI